MTEDKSYPCGQCGELFDRPIDLAKHVKSEHPKPKEGRGSRAESLLNEEDRAQLREEELELRRLEMQVKRAKLESELNRYKGTSEPPRLRKWSLPDGTVIEGSASDYKDLLEIYYMQNQKKSAPTEDSTTTKALLERLTQLEQSLWEKKSETLEKKVDYLASRDPLADAQEAIQKFNNLASAQGMIKAGSTVSDEVKLRHSDIQVKALGTAIDSLSKKLDKSMARAERLESNAVPILKKLGDIYVDDFKTRHRERQGETVPIGEDELIIMQKNLQNSGVQQETTPAEPKIEPPENKPEPSKTEKMYQFTPRPELKGHDISDLS